MARKEDDSTEKEQKDQEQGEDRQASSPFGEPQDVPKWERLHRKEVRFREDQLSKLTSLARAINKNKPKAN